MIAQVAGERGVTALRNPPFGPTRSMMEGILPYPRSLRQNDEELSAARLPVPRCRIPGSGASWERGRPARKRRTGGPSPEGPPHGKAGGTPAFSTRPTRPILGDPLNHGTFSTFPLAVNHLRLPETKWKIGVDNG